jgi:hypothetical protein
VRAGATHDALADGSCFGHPEMMAQPPRQAPARTGVKLATNP